jgi:outer membrane immunogenic protein
VADMRKGVIGAVAAVVLTGNDVGAGEIYRQPFPPGSCGPQYCGPPALPAGPCRVAPCGPPLYGPAPIPYWPSWNWSGPSAGVNLGYQWGSLSSSGAKPSGFAVGFQGGYNWQFGELVTGVEADIQLSDANDVFANYKFSNPWFGTVRGRAGYAFDNILLYGTLGLAYGRGQVSLSGVSESNLHVGWTAGAGMEVGLTPNWSLKAEYLFIDLAADNYALTQASNGLMSSVVRFGVNYRF